MSYFISTPKSVQKQLRSLPKAFHSHIIEKIRELSNDPRPSGVKKFRGSGTSTYRVRVGNYCIIYEIDDRAQKIYLLEVTDRKDVPIASCALALISCSWEPIVKLCVKYVCQQ